jgi:hypothetical protein
MDDAAPGPASIAALREAVRNGREPPPARIVAGVESYRWFVVGRLRLSKHLSRCNAHTAHHFLLRDVLELLIDFAQYSDLQCHSRRRLAGSPFGDRAHKFVGFCADHRIAFAGAFLETIAVEDGDVAARITDQPCLLQAMGLDRNRVSTDAEHVRKKLLGQVERGTAD